MQSYEQKQQWYDKIEDFEDDCFISVGDPKAAWEKHTEISNADKRFSGSASATC